MCACVPEKWCEFRELRWRPQVSTSLEGTRGRRSFPIHDKQATDFVTPHMCLPFSFPSRESVSTAP